MTTLNRQAAESNVVLNVLSIFITGLTTLATLTGIFSNQGPGPFEYKSIRGEKVLIYGKGIYQHMSAEVAIQGIAQDYLSLFVASPLLIVALYHVKKDSVKWRFVLAGTLAYIFVTYLFYTAMAMYNQYFLVYTALMGASFFALAIVLFSFNLKSLAVSFDDKSPLRFSGGFLIFNAVIITLLWLSVVMPPLLDGAIYPRAVEHYTTLIVQGFDLGLLLPLSFVSGYLLIKKKELGFLLAPVYLIFLSLLMAALVAKIVYMGIMSYNIFPVIIIIPIINTVSIICSYLLIKRIP